VRHRIRLHSGWAAMVAVSLEDGVPVVYARRKLLLVKTFSYTFRQPYHTAEKIHPATASEFVRGVETESRELALGLRAWRKNWIQQTIKSEAAASSDLRPQTSGIRKILASHAFIHTADGELFSEAIRHCCLARSCRWPRSKNENYSRPRQNVLTAAEFLNPKSPRSANPRSALTQDEKLAPRGVLTLAN